MAVWLGNSRRSCLSESKRYFLGRREECITKNGESYPGVSKVIGKLYRELSAIKEFIQQVDDAELQEYWKCQFNIGEKWETWCQLAINNLETINTTGIPLKKLIC